VEEEMADNQAWSNRVVLAASIFAGFGVAHLIDDFLYGVPAEFNLSNEAAQVLGLAFFAALTGLAALAGRGSRKSYLGFTIIGGLLALADVLKHLPEILRVGPWRSGLASGTFSIGLIVSGVVVAVISYLAWRKE
jgi:hypothetical protein